MLLREYLGHCKREDEGDISGEIDLIEVFSHLIFLPANQYLPRSIVQLLS